MTKIVSIFLLLAFLLGGWFNHSNEGDSAQYEGKYRGAFTMNEEQIATGDMEFFSNPMEQNGLMMYLLPMSYESNGRFEASCQDVSLLRNIILNMIGENPHVTENMKYVSSIDVVSQFSDNQVNTTFYFIIDSNMQDSISNWQIDFVGTKVVEEPNEDVASN